MKIGTIRPVELRTGVQVRHLSAGMPPKDAMEVEEEGKVLPKIKADDDPDNEGAYMRLSLLRFRLTRCGVPRAAARTRGLALRGRRLGARGQARP